MRAAADRALVGLGAVAGLLGVGLSAVAAHVTGPGNLDISARFLLAHAPALLAIPALGSAGIVRRKLGRAAGFALVLGLVLFCGDLAIRALAGVAPVPMAAPTGGVVLMLGWALLAVAVVLARAET